MSGTTSILATAGFFINDLVTPQTGTDLDTAVIAAETNLAQAGVSATNAAISAQAASDSANASAASATTASAAIPAAAAAASSANDAVNAAIGAAASATAAAGSATDATTTVANVQAQVTAATASATSAATYAGTAGTQAALATSQANAAASSAGQAAISAVAAAASAGFALSSSNGRNRLQNSRLNVLQRGLGPFTTNGQVTADLWRATSSGSGGFTCSIATVTAGYGPGVTNTLSSSCMAPLNSSLDFQQRMVAADVQDLTGQTITVSFYSAVTTTSGTVGGYIYVENTAGLNDWTGASTITTIAQSAVFTPSATPGRYSATFTGLGDSSKGLLIGFRALQVTGTGTLTHQASGFQLEIGNSVTALDLTPIADDNSRCLRNYFTTTFAQYGYTAASITNAYTIAFPQPMRAIPTATLTGSAVSNVTGQAINPTNVGFTVISAGVAAGGYSFTGTATFSAEV